MKKLEQFRMYSFNNADIIDNSIIITEKKLKLKEVRLSENFLVKVYCLYTGRKFEDNLLITDIIKVMISSGKNKSMEQVKGIKFNDTDYVVWFSTPGMMKKEDKDTHSKCEYYFIKKEMECFKNFFENLISLWKLNEFEGKEICINKDVIARIALTTSSSFETDISPKIIILPECEHVVETDIVTLIDGKATEITEQTQDENLKKLRQVRTTPWDGCGLMSPQLADKIKADFAGIRMYNGLAVKGLVCRMDFIKYFQEFFNGDTEYFKKENGEFYIKDMYGDWQNASNADLILNETQVKWAKQFLKEDSEEMHGMNEVNLLMDKLDVCDFKKYKDLLSHLYICKTNKPAEELKEYTLTNYQLLSNLAITEKEMDALSAETERVYKEILGGNEDLTRLFWGDIVDSVETDEEGNIITEQIDSMSTQAQALLKINPQFIDSAYVRRAIARMINKKINLLAAGKFYIKGDYKTFIQDPIYFCDWMINRTDDKLNARKNGLEAHNFYCTGIENGVVRTISRCPLNSFSEIQNITFTRNDVHDRYLGYLTKELIFFNCLDLTAAILSGADFDLDAGLVIDNEIIRNSVVEDLPLVNLEDGNKNLMIYNEQNRIEATLAASGNLIGSLAMAGMSICNLAQQAMYRNYKCNDTGGIWDYQSIKDAWTKREEQNFLSDNPNGKYVFDFKKFNEFLETKFEYIDNYYTEQELKEQIKEGFFNYRDYSYELRFLQQKAIDAPKTLVMPKIPQKYKELKKPRFLYYAKDYIRKKDTRNLDTALNLHATRIARDLIREDIKQQKTDDNLKLLRKYLSCTESAMACREEYVNCKNEIEQLYKTYKTEVHQSKYNLEFTRLKKSLNNELCKLDAEKKCLREKHKDELMEKFEADKKGITDRYLPIKLLAEVDCILEADRIIEKYKKELISHSLIMLECRENFIFKFFFAPVAEVLQANSDAVHNYIYVQDDSGDIEYLFRKYKKVTVKRSSIEAIEILQADCRMQYLKSLSKQSKEGFTKEVGIGNCMLDNIDFDKVLLKRGSYFDKKSNMKRETIDVFAGDKKVGYVYPEYIHIDDFTTLDKYVDREMNFTVIKRNHSRLQAVLNFIN